MGDRRTSDEERSSVRITLTYVVVGTVWVTIASVITHGGDDALVRFDTVVDWGLVLVTGAVLYLLLRRRAAALRRSEIARREHESLLEHVATAGPVVLFRLELHDGQPNPTWVSDSVERLFGYTPAETFAPGWWLDHVHPDDRAGAERRSAEVTQGQDTFEYRLQTKQGEYRWVRDVLRTIDHGGAVEILGVWMDVTEQRATQLALEERERFFRGLIENASDSIVVLDDNGVATYASPSVRQHTGIPPEEFVGLNAFELIHPEDLPQARAAYERAFRDPEETVDVGYRVRHTDGSWHAISSVGQILPGSSPRLVVNSRDVTERHVMEEQFRHAQKFEAIGELTAGIVHDFNNILSVVLSNAELLLGDLPTEDGELRTDVVHIKRAAQSGADVVQKLLGFSRQADLRIAPMDLRPVVEDVATMLQHIVPASIRVEGNVQEPLPLARADAGAVQQILLNLATNARDAMPEGGTLTIEAERAELDHRYAAKYPWVVPGEYVKLIVTDTGAGMDEATRARIFEPFFTTKPPGKGTGLGMPMIFGLAKQHGGHVDLTTEVGGGTSVSVCLPAAPADSVVRTAAGPATPRRGTETILLTEDEEALRRTGKRVLERFGYTVLTARDGPRCLEALEERLHEVDLVVSDMHMPGMTGVQLYHEVRRRGWTVPFLFASGEGAGSLRDEPGLADVGYVQKPWTIEELGGAVRAALDGSVAP